jgi:hypothetical protein
VVQTNEQSSRLSIATLFGIAQGRQNGLMRCTVHGPTSGSVTFSFEHPAEVTLIDHMEAGCGLIHSTSACDSASFVAPIPGRPSSLEKD